MVAKGWVAAHERSGTHTAHTWRAPRWWRKRGQDDKSEYSTNATRTKAVRERASRQKEATEIRGKMQAKKNGRRRIRSSRQKTGELGQAVGKKDTTSRETVEEGDYSNPWRLGVCLHDFLIPRLSLFLSYVRCLSARPPSRRQTKDKGS